MEIQFKSEIMAILERDAVLTFGSKGTPEELVGKIVNDLAEGRLRYTPPGGIILDPETLEVLKQSAKLENIAPEDFIERIVKDFFTGKIHYGTTGETRGSSIHVIGDCMHPPVSASDPISDALQAICVAAGMVKSASYNKSENAITLDIQFEKDVTNKKKHSIPERLKSVKVEWLLDPPDPAPKQEASASIAPT